MPLDDPISKRAGEGEASPPVPMATYELPLAGDGPPAPSARVEPSESALPEPLLLRNLLWFCRFRWIIVAILAGFGVFSLFPQAMGRLGRSGPLYWPLLAAAILAAENLAFLAHVRLIRDPAAPHRAVNNLWTQIILDLLVLTAVVHFLGVQSVFHFAYLFHIALACIFFPRGQSLAVTVLACLFYTLCLLANQAGLVHPSSLFDESVGYHRGDYPAAATLLNLAVTLVIWLVVWYLASGLSDMLRRRDRELARTNKQLLAAQAERTRHMLATTHQLKAPFAAIHANAQLLLKGLCGPLPDDARQVVQAIAQRCLRLTREIQEMLQLANLRSASQAPPPRVELDVAELLRRCVGQIRPLAEERGVVLEQDLSPARAVGVEDHLEMLFGNLLSNAVIYSRRGGKVRVRCQGGEDGAEVVIEDEGIGIAADKLPRIFEEYFHTEEAVRHNKESSGLGLAIVRHVAQAGGIRVRVASRPGAGTRFEVLVPGDGDREP